MESGAQEDKCLQVVTMMTISQSSHVRVRKVLANLLVQLSGKCMSKSGGSPLSWEERELWHHKDLSSSSSWLASPLCDLGKVI